MRIAPLGVDHIVLRIENLERSMAFYCDILGCVMERRRDEMGLYHLRAGAAQIDLVTLAGALGQQLWVALPFVPHHYWMMDRDDSPWYPTARLFRQRTFGEWGPVFDDIATALGELRR